MRGVLWMFKIYDGQKGYYSHLKTRAISGDINEFIYSLAH